MTPNNRLGTKSVQTLLRALTERDQRLLRSVWDHKFLSTKQIYALHFWNHQSYASGIRACTRVLERLRAHGLLYRLDRPVGGSRGGSTSYIWGLDAAGDRLVRHLMAAPTVEKRSRAFEPTIYFLAHILAVADIRILLETMARNRDFELIDVQTEPANWRPFITRSGSDSILKPDLYAATASSDFEDHYFIEVDRSTESLPTLLRKCLIYEQHRAAGSEQTRLGLYPFVIWLLPNLNRQRALTAAIEKDKGLSTSLFRVLAPDELEQFLLDQQVPLETLLAPEVSATLDSLGSSEASAGISAPIATD